MFTITSFADVLNLARTFGVAALNYAVDNRTLNEEQCRMVIDCFHWAKRSTIEVQNFNDGNTEYSIDAVFHSTKVGNMYITNLNDITINRQGFWNFILGAQQAMEHKEISTAQLTAVLKEIADRNEARAVLGL